MSYFTLKKSVKIDKRLYRKHICYEINKKNTSVVEELVKAGLAEKRENYVYFQNGREIGKKEENKVVNEKKEKKAVVNQFKPVENKEVNKEIDK